MDGIGLKPRITRAVADLVAQPGNEDVISLEQIMELVAMLGCAHDEIAAFVLEMVAFGYRGAWHGDAFVFRRNQEMQGAAAH